MKNLRLSLCACLLGMGFSASATLPVVTVLGHDYYIYEVKKGDSIYGVAKKFGWDPEVLTSLNPETIGRMEKGDRLYYPLETKEASKETEAPKLVDFPTGLEPIRHTVKRGETVYSISGQYGIPVNVFYSILPSTRKGVRTGEVLVIDQYKLRDAMGKDTFLYTIKKGDTLFALAREYNTSVEQLLKDNPGVSESNFQAGKLLKVTTNTFTPVMREEKVSRTVVTGLDSYTVDKGDTWASVARKTGVPVEELRNANSGQKLKKNEVLTVPRTETVESTHVVEGTDPREETSEGLADIYGSIHKTDDEEAAREVKVAIVVETPIAKRDIEFLRGYLYALDGLKDADYRIGLNVIPLNSDTDGTLGQLTEYRPDIIVNTSEKGIPKWMLNYAQENKSEVLNVFDAKSDTYTQSSEVIQLLTPSPYFYDSVREYVADNFGNRQLIFVGEPDNGDAIAQTIREEFPSSAIITLSNEDLSQYRFDDNGSYLVYSYSNSKDDVSRFMTNLKEAIAESPLAKVTVMGRPSWITLGDQVISDASSPDIFFPSRFYFDTEKPSSRRFIDGFTEFYGRGPLKSYPNYAATGYDLANYFVPEVALNKGDFNMDLTKGEFIQSPLDLERYSTWGGLFNTVTYIIKYTPYSTVEVEKI